MGERHGWVPRVINGDTLRRAHKLVNGNLRGPHIFLVPHIEAPSGWVENDDLLGFEPAADGEQGLVAIGVEVLRDR